MYRKDDIHLIYSSNKTPMKTKAFLYASFLILAIGTGSCKKSSDDNNNVTFKATLNGASEAPTPNASAATGTATFTYNKTTYVLSGSVTFTGITPTAAHIHKGAVGVAGSVVFPLGSGTITSPISFAAIGLDATQQADLNAGLYYVNIHSAEFPGGEIRGQLVKQ
jgi:hypothetical protein